MLLLNEGSSCHLELVYKVLTRQQTYQNIPRRFLNILEHSCM